MPVTSPRQAQRKTQTFRFLRSLVGTALCNHQAPLGSVNGGRQTCGDSDLPGLSKNSLSLQVLSGSM